MSAQQTNSVQSDPAAPVTRRLLLVEDNLVNEKVALAFLDQLGYCADVAHDGIEALEVLAQHDYDAILMDCRMPRMDGYDTTQEIRRRESGGSRTPVIAMTASAMASDRQRCIEAGMDDYLSKPIDRKLLARVLQQWTESGSEGAGATTSGDLDDPIDPAFFAQLLSLGGEEFVSELAQLFLSDLDRRVKQLSAAETMSGEEVCRLAHDLKGSSANMGLTALAAVCARVESHTRGNEFGKVEPLIAELRREAARARDRLEPLAAVKKEAAC
jgi:two-component system sensor histidine kinase/response regulator